MIFLAHYNYDYDESMVSFPSLEAAMTHVRSEFMVEAELGSPDFDDELNDCYENRNWKGFTLHALEPTTGALCELCINRASKGLSSNHARMDLERWIEKQLAKAAA